jgi:hypothetical protein
MIVMTSEILGREEELGVLNAFLDRVRAAALGCRLRTHRRRLCRE